MIVHVETSGGGNQADILKAILGDLNLLVEVVAISSVYRLLIGGHEQKATDSAASPLEQGHLCVAFKAVSDKAPLELNQKLTTLAQQHAKAARQKFVHISLLAYDQRTVMHPQLTLPDPDLHRRADLLVPAAEAWASYHHPILESKLGELVEGMVGVYWGEFYAQGKALLDSSP